MDVRGVSDTLSISLTMVNRLRRAYIALEKMKNDEEYSQYWHPNMFSYFEEVMKSPYLRDTWLGWVDRSDTDGDFANAANLSLLYSWITPSGENGQKKIPGAIQVRYLPDVLGDGETAISFTNDPALTIEQAHSQIQSRQAANRTFDWRSELRRLLETLRNRVPLGSFSEEDINLFEDIASTASQKVEQIRRLTEDS